MRDLAEKGVPSRFRALLVFAILLFLGAKIGGLEWSWWWLLLFVPLSYPAYWIDMLLFGRKRKTERQVEAAIKVASNLYLLTVPGGEEAVVKLDFCLPDSRYRYLMFCMSATAAACAVEMDLDAVGEAVFGLTLAMAQEQATEFFGGPVNPNDALKGITPVFHWFMNGWAKCVQLEKEQRIREIVEIVSAMIHSTESPLPSTESDVERLNKLALQIHCQFPSMRGAFKELLSR